MNNYTRRRFIAASFSASAAVALPAPLWAASANAGLSNVLHPGRYDLTIGNITVDIAGKRASATGINGTVPGPLLRFREGEPIELAVSNHLAEDTSIHWHGLLLPYQMDGVPGVSFPGIRPEETFVYRYDVVQAGTYWYHSHSGLQEQSGIYGPLVIDPAGTDPVEYDREFVIMLSDWTFEDPDAVFARLKKMDAYYNYQRRTLGDFFRDAQEDGFSSTLSDRTMWGGMRMAATDIADVTGATYTYLMNGRDPAANWTGLFNPGERIRLRIINGSAMSFFNVRVPGLEMEVVQTDGINVQPVVTDELQIGTAETYDVVVSPRDNRAYTIFAESIDRSGYARGTLTPEPGLVAEVPQLRERPILTMTDMAMDHGSMPGMDHSAMSHAGMDHSMHGAMSDATEVEHNHRTGPGVANVAENPVSRLAERGTGLADVEHRVLTYADLRSLEPSNDGSPASRVLELHLTGNMERYMWSFDGIKFSEVKGPILFERDERLRMILVNDTMMNHPIHLHGMYVELDNGNGAHNPLKHTVVVKPGERLAVNVTADAPGDWAFHCHLLYHMKAGMMRIVSVVDDIDARGSNA